MLRQALTLVLTTGMLGLVACAGTGTRVGVPAASEAPEARVAAPIAAGTTATLAGSRCQGARCACRTRGDNSAEIPAPAEGSKRFEIRLSAVGGTITLDAPTIGHFDAGDREACFYVDVVPGSTHQVTVFAKEARSEGGVGPSMDLIEYGPKGPYWYPIVDVRCDGPGGHCTREAADAWAATVRTRKRGRLDPCGSTVITGLKWDTSGGAANREGGVFRDLTVTFAMEVKKFATQFAPGSTECVPK
jgi:hypothetical protein